MIDQSYELTINERRQAKGYPPIETVEGYQGEDGNRLLSPQVNRRNNGDPAAMDTPEGKALMHRLAYGG